MKYITFACIALMIGFITITTPNMAYAVTDEHSSSQGERNDKAEYFDLVPIFLSVVGDRGVSNHISLLISLEIEEGEVEELEHYRSKLANAYIQDLYGVLGSGEAMRHGGLVNVDKVRHRLIDITKVTLGDKYKVSDILLQVVHQGDF